MHPSGRERRGDLWSPGRCGDGRGNAPPILFLFLTKRERAVHGPREKIASAGRSAQARTSGRRRGMVGRSSFRLHQTRFPWGILGPGEVPDTLPFSFRWRYPGGKRGPTRASAVFRPHLLPSRAQADLEGQSFRHPPRGLYQTNNRGARPMKLSEPARAGRRLPCLGRNRFGRPPF